jgi:hypothetical protein
VDAVERDESDHAAAARTGGDVAVAERVDATATDQRDDAE